jgi:hypothetical protein
MAGDDQTFAFEVSLSPDVEEHPYDPDERASWGSFSLWVSGTNLCEHTEQGESLRSTHWYILPLLEWFIDSWEPIFHEERLPLANVSGDAATAMVRLLRQPARLALGDIEEFDRLEKWQEWWSRHNLREAADGGIFPDVFLRRWGDQLEVSVGSELPPGTPNHFSYGNVSRTFVVPVRKAAEALHEVINRSAEELLRRRPESSRLARLAARSASVRSDERRLSRLAWLSGYGERLDQFQSIWKGVEDAFTDVDPELCRPVLGDPEGDELVLDLAPQAALLFGSYSPSIDSSDVTTLIQILHRSEIASAEYPLQNLTPEQDIRAPTPGEEGSLLGEAYGELLGGRSADYVDIEAILRSIGVSHSRVTLGDRDVRAVSLVSRWTLPHIAVNTNYRWGNVGSVLRFTLAHELAHLVLDRHRAANIAVSSGPWAPQYVEKRANAFAAALLMPEVLLEKHIRNLTAPITEPRSVFLLARTLKVSVTSLADRLYNIYLISREDADAFKGL